MAVRQNGEILATSLNRDAVYLINPFEHAAYTVYQFGASEGVLGLTEIDIDVFVLVIANVNTKTSTAIKGSAKIYKLKMTAWDTVSRRARRGDSSD